MTVNYRGNLYHSVQTFLEAKHCFRQLTRTMVGHIFCQVIFLFIIYFIDNIVMRVEFTFIKQHNVLLNNFNNFCIFIFHSLLKDHCFLSACTCMIKIYYWFHFLQTQLEKFPGFSQYSLSFLVEKKYPQMLFYFLLCNLEVIFPLLSLLLFDVFCYLEKNKTNQNNNKNPQTKSSNLQLYFRLCLHYPHSL